jgi:hypothetical protein
MFILRRITSDQVEINTCLNSEYVLTLKEKNSKEFEKTIKSLKFDNAEDIKDIYGFVTFNDGSSIMPLYKKSFYYIMTSDGNTFANISLK